VELPLTLLEDRVLTINRSSPPVILRYSGTFIPRPNVSCQRNGKGDTWLKPPTVDIVRFGGIQGVYEIHEYVTQEGLTGFWVRRTPLQSDALNKLTILLQGSQSRLILCGNFLIYPFLLATEPPRCASGGVCGDG
jgi:hypothetical protein